MAGTRGVLGAAREQRSEQSADAVAGYWRSPTVSSVPVSGIARAGPVTATALARPRRQPRPRYRRAVGADGTASYRLSGGGVMFQTVATRTYAGRVRRPCTTTWSRSRHTAALRASERREQIEEWMDVHGRSGAAAAQEATLATRSPRPSPTPPICGPIKCSPSHRMGPDLVEMLSPAPPGERIDRIDTWHLAKIGDDGQSVARAVSRRVARRRPRHRLVAGDSSFTRLDLTQAIASRLLSTSSDVSSIITALGQHAVVPPPAPRRRTPTRADCRSDRQTTTPTNNGEGCCSTPNPVLTHFANTADAPAGTDGDRRTGRGRLPHRRRPSRRHAPCRARSVGTGTVGRTGKTTPCAPSGRHERAGWTVHGLAPSAPRELAMGAALMPAPTPHGSSPPADRLNTLVY
jgi:hypothetical protein